MAENPYVSIVIASRNDDYQGGSFNRFQLALSHLVYQAKKYRLRGELLIVEWNPPADRPRLSEVLSLPSDLGIFSVRFITVPSLVHERYGASKKIQIILPVAVNVGVRRAKGEFIFVTNSDILFSDKLVQFLASEKLDEKLFYRANRFDVDRKVLEPSGVEGVDEFCAKHIIKSYLKDNDLFYAWMVGKYPALHGNAGDFILFSKKYWYQLHGWPQLNNIGIATDTLLCYMAYLAGLSETILDDSLCVYHIDHDSRWKKATEPGNNIIQSLRNNIYKPICNKELKMFLRRSYRNLYKFLLFFTPKDTNPDKRDFNFGRMDLAYERVLFDMLTGARNYAYNDDTWGLPQETFEEVVVAQKV